MSLPEPRSPLPHHRSLEEQFRGILPPRPAPLRKRILWRVLLGLLAFPPSRALLLRLRGGH